MPSRTDSSSSITTISLPLMRFGALCSTVAETVTILVGKFRPSDTGFPGE